MSALPDSAQMQKFKQGIPVSPRGVETPRGKKTGFLSHYLMENYYRMDGRSRIPPLDYSMNKKHLWHQATVDSF